PLRATESSGCSAAPRQGGAPAAARPEGASPRRHTSRGHRRDRGRNGQFFGIPKQRIAKGKLGRQNGDAVGTSPIPTFPPETQHDSDPQGSGPDVRHGGGKPRLADDDLGPATPGRSRRCGAREAAGGPGRRVASSSGGHESGGPG